MRSLSVATAVLLLGGACATLEEIETTQVPEGEDAAEFEGRQALDSDLCWQEIQAASDTPADADAAHAACMRGKGWDEEP